ncbi:MAG TPA: hypothetical protein VFV88_14625 [Steroidobacteraceae bacterium]|nr:hypothetical protein [Steroidobacteraceae bacterium]
MSEAALDQLIELRKKSGFVAAVANVFLPGAGYAYCGRWIIGLFVFMIVVPLVSLVWIGGVLFGVGIKVLFGFYLVMVIDGFLSAGRYNRRLDTEMRLEHTLRQGGTPQRGFADG